MKNGDSIALGALKLDFVLTPMAHWPETMMTLCGRVLFSGDAFGCFGALNGAWVDEQMNCDDYWLEMVRYYSNIVGKYGTPVEIRQALTPETFAQCEALGRALAERLTL